MHMILPVSVRCVYSFFIWPAELYQIYCYCITVCLCLEWSWIGFLTTPGLQNIIVVIHLSIYVFAFPVWARKWFVCPWHVHFWRLLAVNNGTPLCPQRWNLPEWIPNIYAYWNPYMMYQEHYNQLYLSVLDFIFRSLAIFHARSSGFLFTSSDQEGWFRMTDSPMNVIYHMCNFIVSIGLLIALYS